MPKSTKKQAPGKKYAEALDKFGLLPNFEFTKKEKKIAKYLNKNGSADILTISDALEIKPDKTHELIERLVNKGAVIVDEDEVAYLTPLALRYFLVEKQEKKSAKKFYRFLDALSEKELDEFLKLVGSFEVVPDLPPEGEVKLKIDILKEEDKKEEKEEPQKQEKPVRKPRTRKIKVQVEEPNDEE